MLFDTPGRYGLRVDWTAENFDNITYLNNDSSSGSSPCLLIAPIGEDDSPTRNRSDKILNDIVRPALKDCGFIVQRADELSKQGSINKAIIDRLIGDPLVIADLTGQNPNVFYELAIRHATHKPIEHIIGKGGTLPFDVQDMRSIEVDIQTDQEIDKAKSRLKESVLYNMNKYVDTPIPFNLRM